MTNSGHLPRAIYTYWHQGFANAPALVRACVAQLQKINAGWDIYALDSSSVDDYVDRIPVSSNKLSELSLAHRSDLLRTKLLLDHGGVWVDPTVWVSQPFDSWLQKKCCSGIFLFARPGRDRLISNWFIAAYPEHSILNRLFDELCVYWEHNEFRNIGRKPNRFEQQLMRVINRNLNWPQIWFSWPARKILRIAPYMVYHYKFYQVIRMNPELRESFSQMPVVSADGPHKLQRFGLGSPYDYKVERILYDENIPLHKLSYKKVGEASERGSVLDHLIRKSNFQAV